jgi:hypothetical protein
MVPAVTRGQSNTPAPKIRVESTAQAGRLPLVVLDGFQNLPQRGAEECNFHLVFRRCAI